MTTAMQTVTDDDVHNWSAPYIQRRWQGLLTDEQRKLFAAAEYRHHQKGTSARSEAEELNRVFSQR